MHDTAVGQLIGFWMGSGILALTELTIQGTSLSILVSGQQLQP